MQDECCYVCHETGQESLVRTCCALQVHPTCLVALVDKTGRNSCSVCLREHPRWVIDKAMHRAQWRERKIALIDIAYIISAIGLAAGLCGTTIAVVTAQSFIFVCVNAALSVLSLLSICVICVRSVRLSHDG